MPRKTEDNLKLGDLVFAKMKGFPYWPARVCKSETGYKKRVPVFFFGTHQIGHLPPSNIVPYSGNKLKYGGGTFFKGFAEGMWEIQNTPGVGSKLKVPAKSKSASKAASAKTGKPHRPTSVLKAAKRQKVLLDGGGAARPGSPSMALGGGAESSSEMESVAATSTAPLRSKAVETKDLGLTSCSDGPTVKDQTGAEAPKNTRGRKKRAVDQSAGQKPEHQPDRKGPGRRRKVEQQRTALSPIKEHLRSSSSPQTFSFPQKLVKAPVAADAADQTPAAEATSAAATEKEPGSSREAAAAAPDSRPAPERVEMSPGTEEVKGPLAARSPGTTADAEPQKKKPCSSAGTACKEPKSKETSQRETEDKTSGGVKRKREEEEQEEEVQKSEGRSGAESLQKHGTVREGEKTLKKDREEESAEGGGMKTRRADKEKDRKETKRETRSRKKVRKELGEKEGHSDGEMVKKEKSSGAKRKREEEKQETKKVKIDLKKGRRTEEKRERAGGKGKKLQGKEQPEKEETMDTKEEKKRMVKKKGGNEKSMGDESEEQESTDEERQHHLAAKRENLLRSLQGLLKSGGDKKSQKTGDATKKKVEMKKTTGQKSDIRIFISKLRANESSIKPTQERRESAGRKDPNKSRGRYPGHEEQSTAEGKKGETGGEQPKQQEEHEKKNERKIIGKIVKAGQGTRVQVKTMIGGAVISEEDEKRTSKDGKSPGRTDEQKKNEKKSEDRKVEESAEFGRRCERTKTAVDHRKDKKIKEMKDEQSTAEAKRGLKEKTHQKVKESSTESKSEEKAEKTGQGPKDDEQTDEKRRKTDEKKEETRTAKKSGEKTNEKHKDKEKCMEKGGEHRSRRRDASEEKKDKMAENKNDGMSSGMTNEGKMDKVGKEQKTRGRKRGKPDREEKEDDNAAREDKKEMSGNASKPQKKSPDQTGVAVETSPDGRKGSKKAGMRRKSEGMKQKEEEGQEEEMENERKEATRNQGEKPDAEQQEKDGKTTEEETRDAVKEPERRKETTKKTSEKRGSTTEKMSVEEDRSNQKTAETVETQEEGKKQNPDAEEERDEATDEQMGEESEQKKKASKKRAGEEEDTEEEEEKDDQRKQRSSEVSPTDSTLHRIHGEIRISLKTDKPDIDKCLTALDQLSLVYLTSKHVQRHSELVVTLRKLRSYRASRSVMEKASMLYNRFKHAYLLGEGEEVVSTTFLRSLLEEKEKEEEQRAERHQERLQAVEERSDGGEEEAHPEADCC